MQRILRIKQRRSISRGVVIHLIGLLPHARCFAALCMTVLFGEALIGGLRREAALCKPQPDFSLPVGAGHCFVSGLLPGP